MKKLISVTLSLFIIFYTTSCKSRKGDHIQILDEAKQIQKLLINSQINNKSELQSLVKTVNKNAMPRWEISDKTGILVESIKHYRDYKNPGSHKTFTYAITDRYDFVLLDKK